MPGYKQFASRNTLLVDVPVFIFRFSFPVPRSLFPVPRSPFPVSRFLFSVSCFPLSVVRFPFSVFRVGLLMEKLPYVTDRFPYTRMCRISCGDMNGMLRDAGKRKPKTKQAHR